MEQYKQDFIEFMVTCGVLTFGDFTTKSGRRTPFFINTGNYRTGSQIKRLGEFYAAALSGALGDSFDVLYGPAYKGIPLAVTTAAALSANHNHDVAFCFNRKEAKDHGEGGVFIGHALRDFDRVVIVEDVVTAGTSVRESLSAPETGRESDRCRPCRIGRPDGKRNGGKKRPRRNPRRPRAQCLCHRDARRTGRASS